MKNTKKKISNYQIIMSIFHTVVSIFAFYIAYKCNNGFNFSAFIVACCCPYVYIFYAASFNGLCLATGNRY